jgi:uncharacterized protein
MSQLHSAFTLFLSLLVEAMPFLLLGVLLSSSLLLFIDEKQITSRLPNNPILGAFVGSCIGFLFPVCECGNVPVARRLMLKGVSPSIAIAFLLAAPTINPVVIWSTWVAFSDQPQIVILRVVFSLAISTIIGCIFSSQKDAKILLQNTLAKRLEYTLDRQTETPALLQSGTFLLSQGAVLPMNDFLLERLPHNNSIATKGKLFFQNILQEFRELGSILILGSAIAATIQVFVPREIIFSLGQDTVTSILAMMLLAAVVSICSTVDSFFALSFAATFTSGSLLAFLVFGPIIDLKSIGLMLSIFKPRIIIYIFTIVAQLTFIFAFIYSYFF